MRLVAIIFTAFVASGPAAAQSWTEYSYPEDLFTVSFPGVPKAETTTRQGPDGRVVEARTYSVQQDRAAFKMAIVDLSDPPLDENAALDYAVKTLRQEKVKSSSTFRPASIASMAANSALTDGSHSSVAVFYLNGRLYEVEGTVLPPESPAAAIRFQQSLVFTRGVSNRSADADPRRGCRGYRDNPDIASVPENCRRGGHGRTRLPN
jgi:hypothetical protein